MDWFLYDNSLRHERVNDIFLTHFMPPSLFRSISNSIKNFLKFRNIHRKTPVLESRFNNVAGLKTWNFIKNETPTQVFSYEYCEIFKNTYFDEYLRISTSISFYTPSKHQEPFCGIKWVNDICLFPW